MTGTALVLAIVTVALNGGAQLLLRQAALTGADSLKPLSLATSPWFLAGISSYGVSVLTWLGVLKTTPLAVATPFVALVYVGVPLASRWVFGDHVSGRMWMGMALVVLGVTLVASGHRAD